MIVEIGKHTVKIQREAGDPKFYGVREAKGESGVLHHLKKWLNDHGHDFIKKRMWKDGHIVDEMQQYLRTRAWKSPGLNAAIYSGHFAVEGIEVDWNKGRPVTLILERDFLAAWVKPAISDEGPDDD